MDVLVVEQGEQRGLVFQAGRVRLDDGAHVVGREFVFLGKGTHAFVVVLPIEQALEAVEQFKFQRGAGQRVNLGACRGEQVLVVHGGKRGGGQHGISPAT